MLASARHLVPWQSLRPGLYCCYLLHAPTNLRGKRGINILILFHFCHGIPSALDHALHIVGAPLLFVKWMSEQSEGAVKLLSRHTRLSVIMALPPSPAAFPTTAKCIHLTGTWHAGRHCQDCSCCPLDLGGPSPLLAFSGQASPERHSGRQIHMKEVLVRALNNNTMKVLLVIIAALKVPSVVTPTKGWGKQDWLQCCSMAHHCETEPHSQVSLFLKIVEQ